MVQLGDLWLKHSRQKTKRAGHGFSHYYWRHSRVQVEEAERGRKKRKKTGPGVKEVSELPDPNPRVSYRYRDVCDGVTLFCEGITFDRKVVER